MKNYTYRLLTALTLGICLTSCSTLISATRSAPIQDHYGKRSFGAFIDDQWIETKTRVNMRKTNKQLAKSHIEVTSFNGVILLTGQVPNQRLLGQAGAVAQAVRGVKRVHNELSISGPTSLPARANDTWLTSKVKTRLLASSQTNGRRIKVVTENGVVHLMGLLTEQEADRAVNLVRKTFGVQKIVKVFEYIVPQQTRMAMRARE